MSSSSSGESKSRQDDAGNAARVIAPILGLVALVGVYLASRKLRRKTTGEQHELDEFEGDAVEYEIES